MSQRSMATRRSSESRRATWLFLMMTISQTLALNTFYTVEYPAYSFPAQEVTLVFTIEAPNVSSGIAPLSLTTVLDRSESMQGRKLDLLKKTNQYLVEVMKKNSGMHDLGIVTYSNLLNELVGLQPVTTNTGPLMNYLIGNIEAAGTTYLSGGLTKGLEQQKNFPSDKVQAVYLFTDGLPNIGSTNSWDILNEVRAIRNHAGHHISIYTFGFGEDLDANLLWDIANEGNGVAYIISNEDDIPRAFGDAIGGLLSSVAQDVKVTFKPKDGARIKTVESPGDITVLSDGSVEVRLSDLFAQETRDILVTVEAPETFNPGFQNLLYVDTTYKDAVTREFTGQDTVYVGINREPQPIVVVPAERVEVVKIFYITSKVLEEAGDKAENGDDNGAREKFEEAEDRILQSPLQNRPRLAGLLNDIRKVREAVVDRALNRARSGGLLRNLVSSIRDQRSASTSTDQLETASALDTESRKDQREEAKQGVLGDRAFAVAPAPPGPLLGPIGRAVGGAIVDGIVDRVSGSDSDDDGDSNDDDGSDNGDTDDEDSDSENNDSDESSDDEQSSEATVAIQKSGLSEPVTEAKDETPVSSDSSGNDNPEDGSEMSSDSSEPSPSEDSSGNTADQPAPTEDTVENGTPEGAQEPDSSSEPDVSESTVVPEEPATPDASADDSSPDEDTSGGPVLNFLVDAAQQVLSPSDTDSPGNPAEDTSGTEEDNTTPSEDDTGDESAPSEPVEATSEDDSPDASTSDEPEASVPEAAQEPAPVDAPQEAVPAEADENTPTESLPAVLPPDDATNPEPSVQSVEEPGQQSVQPTEVEAQPLPVVPAPVVANTTATVAAVTDTENAGTGV